jgi:hypothetical protein
MSKLIEIKDISGIMDLDVCVETYDSPCLIKLINCNTPSYPYLSFMIGETALAAN